MSDRKSTSGYVSLKNSAAISWRSKKQTIVALSTAEAEYVALCAAVQECIWLRLLLGDFQENQVKPTVIFEDNQSAIRITENPVDHRQTKHIAIKYHFSRQRYESGEISLIYCPTAEMVADIFTKPLPRDRFESLRTQLGLCLE